ncbi:MAG: Fic family protein [Sphingobacteriales bacterium]|nr:Fic family protein [Sphingobacteriales bacterium]
MKLPEKAPQITISPERLVEITNSNEIANIVFDINENYYYWDKVKYLPLPNNILTSEEAWYIAHLRRKINSRRIGFGKYQFRWFSNNNMQELLHHFDMGIGASLESKSLIPDEHKQSYLINSLMEESIASSQIEGAVTTRKIAKEMLRKKRNPHTKSEKMIYNNYLTITEIIKIKNEKLTVELLLHIHKLVSKDTLDNKEEEGALRKTNDVRVVDIEQSEAVYIPPAHDELLVLLNDLCTFFNDEHTQFFIHPIVKASIIHFMIGFIHPFADGNGRTARALFYWYLLKRGYWLTEYLSISSVINKSKAQYARAFLYTETDENDLGYFISYQLRTMQLAYNGLKEYLNRKIAEKKRATSFVMMDNINERQALILQWIYEDDSLILTNRELMSRFNISKETARNDLAGLVTLEWLRQFGLNNKTQAYTKSERFDELIEDNYKK